VAEQAKAIHHSPLAISLQDVEAVRNVLQGGSVIDWHRLAFRDLDEVDRFLRVSELDPTRQEDLERLEDLRSDAVEYLTRNFGYRIPLEVAHDIPARELLLLASSNAPGQMYACVVLKVMAVMNHLAGRQLLFKLPVSDNEVFGFVEAKVVRVVEEIRGAGYDIVEFAWSRKEQDSVVTKLLAKKESIAAHVYDKLRFRLVPRKKEDLPLVLVELLHRLLPFNYVIPGESVNGLVSFTHLVEQVPEFARHSDRLQPAPQNGQGPTADNEFSGPTYHVLNFVADLPVRIDKFLTNISQDSSEDLGSVIFVLTEFQVVDYETAQENEVGENSHQHYKERQHARVKARLSGDLASDDSDDD
jgi:uncharacterized protein (TIGR04552 family)